MQKNTTKVALVTGAGRRIGASTAAYLHEHGFNVIIHYHLSKTEAESLCAELNAKRKLSAIALHANLQEIASLDDLIERSVDSWGRLDVLVNNASKYYKTEMGKVSEYAWEELMNANLRAPLFLSQAAAPHLAKYHGCIVNLTDIHGERPLRDYSVYCMSKAGLIMLTKCLAKELGPDVRVNAVSPGAIIWPEGENELSSTMKEKVLSRITLNHPGDPGAIAKAVYYLINDADYMTGHVMVVDGGRMLSM